MSWLLLGVIRAYWALWPRGMKRECLFRESCSHHVYRVTQEAGLTSGLQALRRRMHICRPGYVVSSDEHGIGLVLCDGSFLPEHQAAFHVMEPVKIAVCSMEHQLSQSSMTQ